MGIMRLARQYDPSRVEAAAMRALEYNTCTYKSMCSILASGLDATVETKPERRHASLPLHDNIRGSEFYN